MLARMPIVSTCVLVTLDSRSASRQKKTTTLTAAKYRQIARCSYVRMLERSFLQATPAMLLALALGQIGGTANPFGSDCQ